jgi:sugar porter (SP) family MFS transporter
MFQVLTSLAISLGPCCVGLSKGYSSPALASLQMDRVEHHHIRVTSEDGSCIGSLSLLGALLGGLLSSIVLRYGRKNSLLLVSIPFSASWMLTVFASSVEMIYCTAFLAGLCSAIVGLVSQVYISEVACPHLRGRLSSCLKIFGHLGLLSSFLMGAWLDWRQLALVCAAAPLLLLVTVQYVPETPSYLVYSGRIEEAERSLQWLRGDLVDVSSELATIQLNIHTARVEHVDCKSVLLSKLVKPVLITCTLMFFNRFSGVVAFNFFAVTIFSQVFSDINPHLGAVISAIVQLVASLLSGVLSDKLGRRPLLIMSGLVMTVALSWFCCFAFYHDINHHSHTSSLDYIPLLCVLMFECAFSAGVQPVSWLLLGELFPLEYRAQGTSFTTAFSYLCAFLGVKTFVDFTSLFGLYGAFWTYGGITLVGVMFYCLVVPETRQEPVREMQVREARTYVGLNTS